LETDAKHPDITPVHVFADLLASGDGRNADAASVLYGTRPAIPSSVNDAM
jgi:hypothetical protein